MKINVEMSAKTAIYRQIVKSIQDQVNNGELKNGDFLPSMNELSNELNISKETVKKAYSVLREMEIIESSQGRGFYISNENSSKIKTLLLFDRISTYKQVLYSSFAYTIGDRARITMHLHNQDVDLFEFFVKENLDKFDYYVITPHFPLNSDIQKRVIKILKKIPNRKLILLDRYLEDRRGNFGAVYQDIDRDIYEGLSKTVDLLKKYKRLNVISVPGSLYTQFIKNGIEKFRNETHLDIKYLEYPNIDTIRKQDSLLILNGQVESEFIELIKKIKTKGLKIGEDVGIIAYNESPLNEIILNGLTVFSTDFKQMGELTANMILEKSLTKIKCNFSLIKRNTF